MREVDTSQGGFVCVHILNDDEAPFYRQFTGRGTSYNVICSKCGQELDNQEPPLSPVTSRQFEELDADCEAIVGEPEIFDRETAWHFSHQEIRFQPVISSAILDVQPFGDQWLVLDAAGALRKVQTEQRTQQEIAHVTPNDLELSSDVGLRISPNQQFAAIVNQRGQHGVVVDLNLGEICMSLDRGTYYPEQTIFPVDFFAHEDRTLIVHGTSWNRLDIHELPSGNLLSAREPTRFVRGEPRPEHYLDFFHGRLLVSPDHQWIAEDGWQWHPIGINRLWSLSRWLAVNVWESEDGESVKNLTYSAYHWNRPLCWISESQLAIWGFGTDDDWMAPAVQIFDADAGKLQRWFAGPRRGQLFFDTYLFSSSDEGTDIWDIETGERLLHDPDVKLIAYNTTTNQFISHFEGNEVILSHLVTDQDPQPPLPRRPSRSRPG